MTATPAFSGMARSRLWPRAVSISTGNAPVSGPRNSSSISNPSRQHHVKHHQIGAALRINPRARSIGKRLHAPTLLAQQKADGFGDIPSSSTRTTSLLIGKKSPPCAAARVRGAEIRWRWNPLAQDRRLAPRRLRPGKCDRSPHRCAGAAPRAPASNMTLAVGGYRQRLALRKWQSPRTPPARAPLRGISSSPGAPAPRRATKGQQAPKRGTVNPSIDLANVTCQNGHRPPAPRQAGQ